MSTPRVHRWCFASSQHTRLLLDGTSVDKTQEQQRRGNLCPNRRKQLWKANLTCHNCNKKGHITWECPNKNKAQVDEQIHANVQEEDLDEGDNIFVQKEERGILNKKFILLDNQSTVYQIANPKLLKNIRKANKPITVHCNAGSPTTDLKGELGSMTVKHNPYSIANVFFCFTASSRDTE